MPMRPLAAAFAALVLAFVAVVAGGCQGNVFSLKVGQCFSGLASGEVSDVNTVDCATAHDSEVFSVFDYPNPPSDFPGADAVNAAATAQCATAFQDYVGVAATASTLYSYGWIAPTADSWKAGDHQIICLIHSATQGSTLTGSAKSTAK